ncbi:LOG family protein [Spirulina sp. CS-785/01]|uniref:LOG family protein n=1 Tax=Spirulina sp. CS-785/01 TaxID=3021716 RepID=UPI00232B75F2|nr:LOG family protein [Spirulina sp. CS-785/01]MDB9315119.1 LOG family protein [Spirulina sp. CS-785/01]
MAESPPTLQLAALTHDVKTLLDNLPDLEHNRYIQRALGVLVRLTQEEVDRLDWKILSAALEDLERGFQGFYPTRHVRKVSIFGSARTPAHKPVYRMAVEFARRMTQMGFMVITGAGDGIMAAGNEGAGRENSFGLNIRLPFEQGANPHIADDPKLLSFKYFFTRKLFFLKESDAIALFPGGFGTLDEAFESLTLLQTGKYGPAPVVFIGDPGSDYWNSLDYHIREHLLREGLISPDDPSIYTVTDDLDVACGVISRFYRVYHSSRYVNQKFVMRLNCELADEAVEFLNREFSDLLVQGKIEKTETLPEEKGDETEHLPRLIFEFNQKDAARLCQMINKINQLGAFLPESDHPERK